ncbi:MAG: hypothetical protein OXM57_09470 [bacterium]|nr:hypothetical protein [bacterium]MDE0352907.1 hypothetical protein [bacterium]
MRRIIGFHVVLVLLLPLAPATVAHAQGEEPAYDEEAVYDALAGYFNRRISSAELIRRIEEELDKPRGGPPSPFGDDTRPGRYDQRGILETCGGRRQPPLTPEMIFSRLMYFCDTATNTWALVQIPTYRDWTDEYHWPSGDYCVSRHEGRHRDGSGKTAWRNNPHYLNDPTLGPQGGWPQEWACRPAHWREANPDLAPPG